MNQEEQQITIAEVCGWSTRDGITFQPDGKVVMFSGEREYPDYLNDLNEMHEAEIKIIRVSDELTLEYFNQLSRFAGPNARSIQDSANIFCASAAQRAEAFLRTIKKWKE